MAHIHTEPGQHDHTASAFIVRTDGDEPRLALHLHKLLGKFMQFGGHIELHENPWQAVAHEVREESGYELKQLRLLQPPSRMEALSGAILHPSPACYCTHQFGDKDHFHTDAAYAFVTDEPPKHAVSDGESTDLRLLTRDQLAALDESEIIEDIREIGLFVMDTCVPDWEKVTPPSP